MSFSGVCVVIFREEEMCRERPIQTDSTYLFNHLINQFYLVTLHHCVYECAFGL